MSAKEYSLMACTRCGQHYCDPAPTAQEIVGFYQGDYHKELRNDGDTKRTFGPKFGRYRD
jgi:hypothetical protein